MWVYRGEGEGCGVKKVGGMHDKLLIILKHTLSFTMRLLNSSGHQLRFDWRRRRSELHC